MTYRRARSWQDERRDGLPLSHGKEMIRVRVGRRTPHRAELSPGLVEPREASGISSPRILQYIF